MFHIAASPIQTGNTHALGATGVPSTLNLRVRWGGTGSSSAVGHWRASRQGHSFAQRRAPVRSAADTDATRRFGCGVALAPSLPVAALIAQPSTAGSVPDLLEKRAIAAPQQPITTLML